MINTNEILKAKVLIVDDQESGARALKALLEHAGYSDVSYTTDPREVCELHSNHRYQLILLDLQMPDMSGFQVMEKLNAAQEGDYVPVLALTAEPAYKIHALKRGAKDFICKPYDPNEVLSRVRNMLEIRLLHERALNAATTLEILAQQDPLTGLGNRRLIHRRISAALANARRHKSSMAVVYLDLDGFKQINDAHGHSVGDSLLKAVAQRLESVVREEDTVARIGGDEFIIALWHVANANDAAIIASKLIKEVAKSYVIASHDISVTTSAGVSIYPGHGNDLESLTKSADDALYEAKHSGKNAFRISEQAITPS